MRHWHVWVEAPATGARQVIVISAECENSAALSAAAAGWSVTRVTPVPGTETAAPVSTPIAKREAKRRAKAEKRRKQRVRRQPPPASGSSSQVFSAIGLAFVIFMLPCGLVPGIGCGTFPFLITSMFFALIGFILADSRRDGDIGLSITVFVLCFGVIAWQIVGPVLISAGLSEPAGIRAIDGEGTLSPPAREPEVASP